MYWCFVANPILSDKKKHFPDCVRNEHIRKLHADQQIVEKPKEGVYVDPILNW